MYAVFHTDSSCVCWVWILVCILTIAVEAEAADGNLPLTGVGMWNVSELIFHN